MLSSKGLYFRGRQQSRLMAMFINRVLLKQSSFSTNTEQDASLATAFLAVIWRTPRARHDAFAKGSVDRTHTARATRDRSSLSISEALHVPHHRPMASN